MKAMIRKVRGFDWEAAMMLSYAASLPILAAVNGL